MLIVFKLSPRTVISNLFEKRLRCRCFPVNFAKFLRTPFPTEHLRWLLLDIEIDVLRISVKEPSLVKLLYTYSSTKDKLLLLQNIIRKIS